MDGRFTVDRRYLDCASGPMIRGYTDFEAPLKKPKQLSASTSTSMSISPVKEPYLDPLSTGPDPEVSFQNPVFPELASPQEQGHSPRIDPQEPLMVPGSPYWSG